jgi:hypothetical protein
MPRLIACPSCSVHSKSDEAVCPHCGAPMRDGQGAVGRTAGAVLMGLAITACPGDDGGSGSTTTVEPEYGVPATDSAETGSEGGSSGGASQSSTSASTSASTTMQGTTDAGEAEYGVPDTGFDESTTGGTGTDGGSSDTGSTSVEPDYGVPESGG